MFAVMGATGQTGGAALDELRQFGISARAITREPGRSRSQFGAEVEVVGADPMDPDALADAFEGMDGVYVMVPPYVLAADLLAEGRRTAEAIAEAIRRAKVRHVVALSSGGAHLAEGTGVIRTLFDFERALRKTGASITFIRPADFMENWIPAIGVAQAEGVLPSGRTPLDGKMETVSTVDIGRLAARCLVERREGERIINLLGPEDYSPVDVAEALSKILGKTVTAVPIPRDDLLPMLLAAGMGEDYAGKVIEVYDGLNSGAIGFEAGVGETRRGSVTISQALHRMIAKH